MTWHVLYSSHHPHYIWNGLYRICVITKTLLLVSDQLYVWHHTHFPYAIVCTLHNVTSTLYDFTPLYSSHYIHCIHDITHPIYDITHFNRNVISAIWPTISNTTSTVSVKSNSRYQLYHTHSLYDIEHTIRVSSYSVSMLPQQIFTTLYPSMYNITPSVFMISYPKCTLSHTSFMTTQRLDLTFHPPYWHHRIFICVITQMAHTSVSMHCSINDITTCV